MEEDKFKLNSLKNPLWRQGIKLFSEISTWIVVPIVGALILGKFLDKRFETGNTIFLSLVGVAFAITCYGIIRITQNYLRKIKKEEEEAKNKNNYEHNK